MTAGLAHEIALVPGQAMNFEEVPNAPGVFIVWPREGAPYLGKTELLRRRLARLLRPPARQSRLLNLAETAARVEYQPTGSPFESALLIYDLARRYLPDDYRRFLKLRPPVFLKVNLEHAYPRSYLTRRLGRDRALYFGPFSSRVAAERFQNGFLDLFLMRRCDIEIIPDPAHPGCIYGEMQMCLRPCQAAATLEQYRAEVGRVVEFLSSRGDSLLKQLEQDREQASQTLEFEHAARLHKRLEKTQEALKLNEELARDVDSLYGIVVQRSVEPQAVELWFVYQGSLQPRRCFSLALEQDRPVSLDQRLHETIGAWTFESRSPRERSEHLALLLRWYTSSWKKGELLLFDGLDRIPYRKLVRAISRVAAGQDLDSSSSTGMATSFSQ